MFASKDVFLKSSGGGFSIARSARFRNSASAYLSRTPTVQGSTTTWTFSAWIKRGVLSTQSIIFDAAPGATDDNLQLNSSNCIDFYLANTSGGRLTTTQVLRDPSAWYHLVAVWDSTNATSSDRIRLYLNGARITAFSTASYPSQNYALTGINSTNVHAIGRYAPSSAGLFDGYMTEINFVDGAALTPSSFGATDAITGVWQPKKYSGTYGTNGFYLKFDSYATAAALGTDSSGNGNTWTVNNISVTAGVTYDSMTDVPTLTSATVANYAVLNPLFGTSGTLASANLQVSGSGVGNTQRLSSISVSSGKWYCEITMTTLTTADPRIGISNILDASAVSQYPGQSASSYAIYTYALNGFTQKYNNASATNTNATPFVQGDILGIAIDLDSGKIWFAKNNTWVDSGSPSAGTNAAYTGLSGTFAAALHSSGSGSSATLSANFGQQPFTYTPPSGFVALNTYNLSTPTIPNGAVYFAATTYTGNGTSQSISNAVNGTSFQPDFVWYKDRSVARDHALFDVTRGALDLLSSNNTSAAGSVAGTLTSFNSNGYSIGSAANANGSGETYVGWQWKANGAGVTNTSGSITSTVSANTTAGFSIATYTGTGSAATVGHGLGVAPSMVIVKQRNSAADWVVKHVSLSSNDATLILDNTSASTVYSPSVWNNTAPTSTVFSIGTNSAINTNTNTYVAYCFAAVAGYSAFGSYTGNGSTDGPFIYLGFRPRYVMIKRTDSTGDWFVFDTSRDTYNVATKDLSPNSSTSEGTGDQLDILSNGFKLRTTTVSRNASGGTYIYMAFAENPFKYSLAR